jgi:hypothetical protein
VRPSERARDAAWAAAILTCLLFTFYTASVHRTGLHYGRIDLSIVWYYVHGPQETLWVPYIHPPLYAIFMNTLDALYSVTGVHPMDQVLLVTAGVQFVLTGLAAGLRRHIGRTGSALAAILITLTPSSMRPLEQYPVAALLVTLAVVGLLGATRASAESNRGLLVAAALLAFATVEMSLLLWFPLGALFVHLLITRPLARRSLLIAAGVVTAAFLATTLLGFWEVLPDTRGDTPDIQGMSIGWSNPALFAVLLGAAVPAVRRHSPAAAPVAVAVVGFAGTVLLLQKLQLADGAPYPESFRYFSMIDPLLALGAAAILRGAWLAVETRGRVAVAGVSLLLVVSQGAAYVDGEQHIWGGYGFAEYARPWRSPPGQRVPLAPTDAVDIFDFSDARKDCMREECELDLLHVEGRGLLTGDSEPLSALRICLVQRCPDE